MKKLILAIITAVVLFSSIAAIADDDIAVLVDGEQIEFDTPPIIQRDRTMVPMRAIFEKLGAAVSWNGVYQEVQAVKDDTTITLYIGLPVLYKNTPVSETLTEIDAPPVIVNDRTLVPVRAISEAFACNVSWDGETRTVYVRTDLPPEKITSTPAPAV